MVSKATIATAIVFIIILGTLTVAYFMFETSSQISLESIKVYWKGSYFEQSVNPSLKISGVTGLPNYTITNLKLTVGNIINDSAIDFQIECTNLMREVDFADYTSNESLVGNFTRLDEYEKTHHPDIMVSSTLIKNGGFLTWSQVWNSFMDFNTITVDCKPFLKKVSYATWAGKWLFDGTSVVTDVNGTAFATANVAKVTFEVSIPDGYTIQNPELYNLHEVSGGFTVEKSIVSGDTFQLIVIDNNLASNKAVMDYVIWALWGISLVMGVLLSWLGSRSKQWHRQNRRGTRHR